MRSLFKWIGLGLLALILLGAACHRPLIFRLTRYYAVRTAEKQNLALNYQISGSIFTNLKIRSLTADPTGPSSIEKIKIGEIDLQYSLWGLLTKGWPGFLKAAVIRDADVVLDPSDRSQEQAKSGSEFKFPAIIPQSLVIDDLNVTIRQPGDDLVVQDLNLDIQGSQAGKLSVRSFRWPGIHRWDEIAAMVTYADRDLILHDLNLGPGLQLHILELDMSKLSGDTVVFRLEGLLFGGRTTASGDITDLHEQNQFEIQLSSSGNSLAAAGKYFHLQSPLAGTLTRAHVNLKGSLYRPVTWNGEAGADLDNFVFDQTFRSVDGALGIRFGDGRAVIEKLRMHKDSNAISLTANAELPDHIGQWRNISLNGALGADLDDVGKIVKGGEGQIKLQGDFAVKEGKLRSDLHVNTKDLATPSLEIKSADATLQLEKDISAASSPLWRDLVGSFEGNANGLRYKNYTGDELHFSATSDGDRISIRSLRAKRGDNQLHLSGDLAIPEKLSSFNLNDANLAVDLKARDLKQLVANQTGTRLEGKLTLKGKLTRREGKLAGAIALSGRNLRYGDWQIKRAAGAALIDKQTVKLQQLKVDLAAAGSITAIGSYQLEGPNALKSRIAANVDLAAMPLPNQLKLRGTINTKLVMSGTLLRPTGDLTIRGRNLDSKTLKKLGGVDADAKVHLADDQLKLSATVRQRHIKPLRIGGHIPFEVSDVLRNRRLDPSAPVDLSVKLPTSSIAFVSKILPQVRYSEGSLALNLNVAGTLRDPRLGGSAILRAPALRMRNSAFPRISDARLELHLHDREVTIQTAALRVAGGPLKVDGKVTFDELTKPVLNLHANGKTLLLARNKSLNVRGNADLSITGPLSSAHVSGRVGITQSRFFRDVEILPITLPGRPAPSAAIPGERANFSIDAPPLRDWTFDVAIKTDQPFKIRGNLTHGEAVADLTLRGSGQAPTLEGTANLKDLVLSLPFSRVRITRGSAYFTPGGEILNPKIDMNGVSEMRGYRINVYVYGTAADPKAVFSSEPPLPQEEVISLLATGATRQELLANGGSGAAGRAAWLALKELYHKTFGGEADRSDADFLNRFDVDLGGVDPRTGKQRFVTRFRISDHWMLVATTTADGSLQGKVKYVIRFR